MVTYLDLLGGVRVCVCMCVDLSCVSVCVISQVLELSASLGSAWCRHIPRGAALYDKSIFASEGK